MDGLHQPHPTHQAVWRLPDRHRNVPQHDGISVVTQQIELSARIASEDHLPPAEDHLPPELDLVALRLLTSDDSAVGIDYHPTLGHHSTGSAAGADAAAGSPAPSARVNLSASSPAELACR